MEMKLVPKLQLGLVMTPQLKMAIKLLTLNHLELKDAVAQELIDNPVLDEVLDDRIPQESREAESASLPAAPDKATEVTNQPEERSIDWEAYADQYSYLPPSAGGGADGEDLPGIDQTLTRSETLEEHLLWQIRMSDMNALERQIAISLLGEMNDEGFLDLAPKLEGPPPQTSPAPADAITTIDPPADDGDLDLDVDPDAPDAGLAASIATSPVQLIAAEDVLERIARDLDVEVAWVDAVRKRIMRLDPVGCLSRDLRECLLTQLEVWGYDDDCLVWNILDKYIKEAEKKNYAAITKACKCSMEDVGEALKLIEQLEPRPARNFISQGSTESQQYITPDVYVMKINGEWVISHNEDGMPKLKMSKFYIDKMKEAQQQKAAGIRTADPSRSYIKEKMRTATWLIKSIHQRQRTIYRVVESILKYQGEWFDVAGPLKPLILKQVADDIEMHESTISRVTTRKYMHTPRGVFELKYFFNSSINTGDGENIASESVKDEIKRIVQAENPKKPLSDAAIVKMLSDKNIEIARRTVAKYREVLGIMPSNQRKAVF